MAGQTDPLALELGAGVVRSHLGGSQLHHLHHAVEVLRAVGHTAVLQLVVAGTALCNTRLTGYMGTPYRIYS